MGKGGDATKQQQHILQQESKQKPAPRRKVIYEEFYVDNEIHWHMPRAREILKAHPEVGKLMGPSPFLKYKVIAAFFLQWASLEILKGAPLWMHVICCYTLGGMVSGSMTLALHELSHNLGAKGLFWNKVIAMFANATMGIPAAATFKRYHAEHHKFLGEHHVDVDIPTYFEGTVFQTRFWKLLWLMFQPAWYGLRPMVLNSKTPNAYEICNMIITLSIDLAVFWSYGLVGVSYIFGSTIFGMQLHPVAGHFVAEHYILNEGQETYSYYGPLNWIGFNVGYHIEHHDFPFVPESRLAELRATAPEFYNLHPCYHSWIKVMVDFVMDPHVTPFSRIKRHRLSEEEKRRLRERGGLTK